MKRIIYHDEDPDGWMSAAVILKKFPESETYQISKSQDILELKSGYDEVFIVDHSLWKESNLQKIVKQNDQVHWIDHHEKAIENYSTHYKGLRDTKFSACVLAWKYFFPNTEVPKSVFHVGDKDLWEFKDKNTSIFSDFLRTLKYGTEIENYIKLIDKKDLSLEYTIGKHIQNYKQNILEQMYSVGIKRKFLGYNAMVFDGEALRSELMHIALERNPDIDIAVVQRTAEFTYDKKMIGKEGQIIPWKTYKYSLRSKSGSDIDVGEICIATKEGSGHKHAAGIVTNKVL